MTRNKAGIALAFALVFASRGFANQQPNVVVILADDLGYSDIGCFGGEVSTPNLNDLASEGIRFTRCFNGGMCVVSRASLLTGQWWPSGLRNFTTTPLLSTRLQRRGYRTALIGKWHLQGHPLDRGFDHFFGFLSGFADHFSGAPSYQLDREPFKDFGPHYYSSDALSQRAVEFIERREDQAADKPYFLYLSYQAPHNPLQAPEKEIAKYRGQYANGWQATRLARFDRQKKLGIVSEQATLPAYPENLPDWDSLTPQQRDLEDLRMSVYAAMVDRMDQGIGRVIEAIRRGPHGNNTMVIFLSDNGTDSFSVVDDAMLDQEKLPGDRGSNYQPGTGWAYASVTPWRMYKISQHAGGVTSGGIVWWPAKIDQPGSIQRTPIHMVDILPTAMAVSTTTGESYDSHAVHGESILPAISHRSIERSGPLFFQYKDNRAIRTARWTLAEVDGTRWELFDIASDPNETTDVSSQNVQVVEQLSDQWLQWWKEQNNTDRYEAESTRDSPHYQPQGDRGSGSIYEPSAMPAKLKDRYPVPTR